MSRAVFLGGIWRTISPTPPVVTPPTPTGLAPSDNLAPSNTLAPKG